MADGPEDRDGLRREILGVLMSHDPKRQGHKYNRCEHCHYTSHPCDAFDMAELALRLLDEGRTGEWESDAT